MRSANAIIRSDSGPVFTVVICVGTGLITSTGRTATGAAAFDVYDTHSICVSFFPSFPSRSTL
jgi:hypothetical protein